MVKLLILLFKWATGKLTLLPSAWINMRYALCKACDFHKRSRLRESCGQCGCTISRRRQPLNKLAYSDEQCPIGKWTRTQ